jgi:hypothetical protein
MGVNVLIEDMLRQAFELESKNQLDEALKIYSAILAQEPQHKEVLLHTGSCLFAMEVYDKALDYFVMSYMHPEQTEETKKVILQDLLSAYYQPNEATFRHTYEKNVARLKAYEHNYLQEFLPFEALDYLCIPASDDTVYLFEKKTAKIPYIVELKNDQHFEGLSPQNYYLTVNIFKNGELEELLKNTTDPSWVNGMKVPICLIWENQALFQAYLQLNDYETLIASGRLVFFDTYTSENPSFLKFFSDKQSFLPTKLLGEERHFKVIMKIIEGIYESRYRSSQQQSEEIKQWYSKYNRDYYRNLFSGDPKNIRILFYTSRFTQVVQYVTRDFMQACSKFGITCDLLIDKSDLHRAGQMALLEKISDFNPNVIFRINYFRSDFSDIPENLMFITWVQDPVVQVKSEECAMKFGSNDYILSYSGDWTQKMIEVGFPSTRIMQQVVCYDEQIFYPRIEESERMKYGSEVTICANNNRIPEKMLSELISRENLSISDSKYQQQTIQFYNGLYSVMDQFVQNGGLFVNKDQCLEIILNQAKQLNLNLSKNLDQAAETIFLGLTYGLHRKYVIRSIYEAEFQLKLWGKDWDKSAEFAPYAMGWVEHGPELAKVYSYSKIVIGAFSHVTAHYRIWEAIACGSLVMVRNVPREFDLCDIRDFLTDGDGFVFYDDLKDLTHKIRYYLDHEPERQQIVQNGQAKVKEILSYQAAVVRWLDFVKKDLATNHSA